MFEFVKEIFWIIFVELCASKISLNGYGGSVRSAMRSDEHDFNDTSFPRQIFLSIEQNIFELKSTTPSEE